MKCDSKDPSASLCMPHTSSYNFTKSNIRASIGWVLLCSTIEVHLVRFVDQRFVCRRKNKPHAEIPPTPKLHENLGLL